MSIPKWKLLIAPSSLGRGSFRYPRTGCWRLKGLTGHPYEAGTSARWAVMRVCVNCAPTTSRPDAVAACGQEGEGWNEDGGGYERPATPADVCGDGLHAATVRRGPNRSVTGP